MLNIKLEFEEISQFSVAFVPCDIPVVSFFTDAVVNNIRNVLLECESKREHVYTHI